MGRLIISDTSCRVRLGDFNVVVSTTSQLFANSKFNKNDLVLLPLGQVALQKKENINKSSVVLQMAGWKFEEVLVVTHSKCNFEKKSGHWCPFYWCKEALKMTRTKMMLPVRKPP